ncbi:MAG: PEP-CTERM sorting domain-containing protein [Planctomycetes bacterium]|nr:PEP-CTERM sorting domain-containing protein [Planctomycetota bacterium]
MKSFSLRLGVLLLFLSLAPISRADIVRYQADFESPTYATGGLVGQDQWIGTAIASVQTAIVHAGTQALEFDANLDTNNSQQTAQRLITLTADAKIVMQTAFYLTSDTTASAWIPLAAFGENGIIGQLFIGANGQLKGVDVVHDQWNILQWVLDFNAQSAEIFLNDASLGTTSFANAATGINRIAAGLSQNPGTDHLYLDDLSITAIPEPGSMTLLGLSAFSFVARPRGRAAE